MRMTSQQTPNDANRQEFWQDCQRRSERGERQCRRRQRLRVVAHEQRRQRTSFASHADTRYASTDEIIVVVLFFFFFFFDVVNIVVGLLLLLRSVDGGDAVGRRSLGAHAIDDVQEIGNNAIARHSAATANLPTTTIELRTSDSGSANDIRGAR